MSEHKNKNIIILENAHQNNIVERRKHDRRQNTKPFVLPASLMTHIMVDYKGIKENSEQNCPPFNASIDAYQSGAAIAKKRVPAGWQEEHSA